jgi:hypothetical protein
MGSSAFPCDGDGRSHSTNLGLRSVHLNFVMGERGGDNRAAIAPLMSHQAPPFPVRVIPDAALQRRSGIP